MGKSSLEQRVTELEQEISALRKKLVALTGTKPWWESIAGTFEHDPVYEQAMRLGQKYRRAQRPNGAGKRNP